MTRRWPLPVALAFALLVLVALVGTAAVEARASAAAVCRSSCVDLSVSVSDGVGSLVPGFATVYVVTVRNAGPSSVSSLMLTDTLPAAFRNVAYAPVVGSYKASTHVWSGLSLASGRSVSMLVAGTVDPAATGTLTNTVTVAAPSGVTETSPANNSATDTDTLTPLADLSVGLSDGVTSLVAGRSTVYTVTVRNNGLSTVGSLLLTDTSPSSLSGLLFAPASGSYSPSTHLWSGLSLASGQSVSMTVTGTVAPAATGSVVNTVAVAPPAGVGDPVSANNSASDSDKLTAQADLSITNSDGATTAAPGLATTYTVVVSNPGPSTATGATVSDSLPSDISGDSWTGPNGTSGNGNLHATVTVPAGGTVTYAIDAAVSASATGTLVDTATVTAPAGLTDTNSANNSATDTDTLVPQTDLSVSNSDGLTSLAPGATTSYTIVVTNHGPLTAAGAVIADSPPATVTADSWTGPNGTSGSGPLNTTTTLPAGSSATYILTATIDPTASGSLTDTATVTAPAGLTDPNPANNSASDSDTLDPTGDLQISNSDGAASVTAGTSTSYTITVTNAGPSTVSGATVADAIPAGIDSFSWTGSDGSSGNNAIDTTITLAPAATITYTIDAAIDPAATGSISNTATITAPANLSDPNPTNNSATDTDTVIPGGIIVSGRVKLGDLYLCNLANLTVPGRPPANVTDMEGRTVRQFLALDEQLLGGGSGSADSFLDLDTLTGVIDGAFYLGTPADFADQHLSTSQSCQPIDWQPNQVLTFGPAAPALGPEAVGMYDYLFENVYSAAPYYGAVTVGDTTDPGGAALTFDSVDALVNYLPASGAPAVLAESGLDPTQTSSGAMGGDVVALALNVDFSDSYTPTNCSPPGSASSNGSVAGIPCPWSLGDMLSFGPVEWTTGGAETLSEGWESGEDLIVGDPNGNHIELTSSEAALNYLPSARPPGALTASFVDPASTDDTGAGLFGGDVLALQLDVNDSDADLITGNAGLNFGDLTLCSVPDFPDIDGDTVRQFLAIANDALAGEPAVYTAAELEPFTRSLTVAFTNTLPGATASYLYNGPCPGSGSAAP